MHDPNLQCSRWQAVLAKDLRHLLLVSQHGGGLRLTLCGTPAFAAQHSQLQRATMLAQQITTGVQSATHFALPGFVVAYAEVA